MNMMILLGGVLAVTCIFQGVTCDGDSVWFVDDGIEESGGGTSGQRMRWTKRQSHSIHSGGWQLQPQHAVSAGTAHNGGWPSAPHQARSSASRPDYYGPKMADWGSEIMVDMDTDSDYNLDSRHTSNSRPRFRGKSERLRLNDTQMTIRSALDLSNSRRHRGHSKRTMVNTLRNMLNVSQPLLSSRTVFHDAPVKKEESIQMAESAFCEPELVTVPIEVMNKTETTFHYPSCTRMRRCGGCCDHHLLTCLPTQINLKKLSVLVLDTLTGLDSTETVEIEEHLGCECGCVVQPHHCNQRQVHVADECSCRCLHVADCPPNKTWDPATCTCVCTDSQLLCSTGLAFDNSTCSCEKLYRKLSPVSSRPPINRRGSYNRHQQN